MVPLEGILILWGSFVFSTVVADMDDVLVPIYLPPAKCSSGCAVWSDLNTSTNAGLWAKGQPPANASSFCAIPAYAVDDQQDPNKTPFCKEPQFGDLLCNSTTSSFYGPICACAGTEKDVVFGTCRAPRSTPEQINLQIASSNAVVVSFVTFETALPLAPPQACLKTPFGAATCYTGVAHWYVSSHLANSIPCAGTLGSEHPRCTRRNYTLSFVRLPNLAPRQRYEYTVRSGAPDAVWSSPFAFRALYSGNAVEGGIAPSARQSRPTRVAIYGDMGNTLHNNMGNLRADCDAGDIDAIVHLGQCVNANTSNMLQDTDGVLSIAAAPFCLLTCALPMTSSQGDAYMQAFQPTLATCPWLPVIGNHESTAGGGADRVDSSTEEHYLNMTWGVVMDEAVGPTEDRSGATHRQQRQQAHEEDQGGSKRHHRRKLPLTSTANSSLGHLLTKGTFYGAGLHSATPSKTSQWSSVDIGLIHFVALDLDPGPPPVFSGEQVAWLEQDLQAANLNREQVPWIVVGSHFPLYAGKFEEDTRNTDVSLAWYVGEESEGERGARPWSSIASVKHCSSSSSSSSKPNGGSGSQQQQPPPPPPCKTVGDALAQSKSSLEPLLKQYAVDIYAAGHIHSYSVSWPLCDGAVCNNTRSYDNPQGTVHLLEGNGGVPNGHTGPSNTVAPCHGQAPADSIYRTCGTGGAYGRLVAYNASVLEYQHVENPTGDVTDRWALHHTDGQRHRRKS